MELGGTIEFHSSDSKGGATFRLLRQGAVSVVYRGAVDEALARDVVAKMNEVLAEQGRVEMFVDAMKLTSYTTEYRVVITDWAKQARHQGLTKIHMLFASRIVAMGVALFSMATGNLLVGYSDVAKFTAAMNGTR